ncbi:MAG TPA: hypothetical protein DCQ59_12840 [Verrucomicrobiales bacterium]|nr:hypothetical protein [Verrucomicrobiales bacterium]
MKSYCLREFPNLMLMYQWFTLLMTKSKLMDAGATRFPNLPCSSKAGSLWDVRKGNRSFL